MDEHFDAIVIGMGPGGEVVADRLLRAGRRVAVVERELVGGECAYWACIPSKTLLRPVEARAEAARAAGVERPRLDWAATRAHRDEMVRHLDDHRQVSGYRERGAEVVKGEARLVAPGRVRVGDREMTAAHVVLATGSSAARPPIPGLDEATVWTNREATTLGEVPDRALVVGGGPVGVELGQFLAAFGTRVTLVEGSERVLAREEARVGELLEAELTRDGVDVRTGTSLEGLERAAGATRARLSDGASVDVDVVVLATGRAPRLDGLGLDALGLDLEPGQGIPVDERCRVQDGLWAVGDVTGVMPFTHVATYQGRVVAENILGGERRASYAGVPRVVFTHPEAAATGLTEAQAREQGLDVTTATVPLAKTLARPWTYEQDPGGELGLLADRERGVLVGAWAVAPLAGEWIHLAATAVRLALPVCDLLDGVAQFPTYTEAYLVGLEALDLPPARAGQKRPAGQGAPA